MARIKGVDIPDNKRIEISLTYIHGVGRSLSNTILKNAKVDINKKTKDLTEDELRREVAMSIKTLKEIGCYRGKRHIKGLPVRGQRTNRNARTRKGKGKVVANKKK